MELRIESATEGVTNRVYVGVDLVRREVVLVARYEDLVRDAYLLRGQLADDGVIVLDDDATYNGEEATHVALSSQGIGLGWTFATTCGYCGKPTTSTSTCSACGVTP